MSNVQDLRKIFSAQGIKGFSSANRAGFTAYIDSDHEIALGVDDAITEDRIAAQVAAEVAPAKNTCGICGKRRNYTGPGDKAPRLSEMCNPCFEEAGWENTHSDANHDAILEISETDRTEDQKLDISACWICHPEMNLAKIGPKVGKSRAGMVIIAKGTEIHKSATFKAAAEAAGWTVTIQSETYELGEDAEGEGTRYYATATRGNDSISLAWDGRAYDYPASSAQLNGKGRKVRNLKEALRFL